MTLGPRKEREVERIPAQLRRFFEADGEVAENNRIPDQFAYCMSGFWCSTVGVWRSTQSQTGRKAGTESHGFRTRRQDSRTADGDPREGRGRWCGFFFTRREFEERKAIFKGKISNTSTMKPERSVKYEN